MVSIFDNDNNLRLHLFGFGLEIGSLSVIPIVLSYSVCSSLLAIVNKAAVDKFPFPSILTASQYVFCVIPVLLLGKTKILHHDPLKWESLKLFFPAALVSCVALFTNTTLLKYANVDTFIVFRSLAPIFVAIADTLFRDEPWPNNYAFASLILIFVGAIGYVITDNEFNLTAYSWALVYLFAITFDMVYIKHVITNIQLSTWGLVLYNNFISLAISPIFWYLSGESMHISSLHQNNWISIEAAIPLLMSCLFGFAISYFGFSCRKAVSATAFTVIGVTNKFLTVIINIFVWSKHAPPIGIFCLIITIAGGFLYQQSVVKWNSKDRVSDKISPLVSNKEEMSEIHGKPFCQNCIRIDCG